MSKDSIDKDRMLKGFVEKSLIEMSNLHKRSDKEISASKFIGDTADPKYINARDEIIAAVKKNQEWKNITDEGISSLKYINLTQLKKNINTAIEENKDIPEKDKQNFDIETTSPFTKKLLGTDILKPGMAEAFSSAIMTQLQEKDQIIRLTKEKEASRRDLASAQITSDIDNVVESQEKQPSAIQEKKTEEMSELEKATYEQNQSIKRLLKEFNTKEQTEAIPELPKKPEQPEKKGPQMIIEEIKNKDGHIIGKKVTGFVPKQDDSQTPKQDDSPTPKKDNSSTSFTEKIDNERQRGQSQGKEQDKGR